MFEFVGRPVPEIERAGRARLKGVPPTCNMFHVQFRTPEDQLLHGARIPSAQRLGFPLQKFKKRSVFDQGYLYRFGRTGYPVAVLQGFQKVPVIDDGLGDGKGAQEILFPVKVDPVLHPNGGVVLGQYRGGDADELDPAVGDGGGIPRHIDNRTAPNGHYH